MSAHDLNVYAELTSDADLKMFLQYPVIVIVPAASSWQLQYANMLCIIPRLHDEASSTCKRGIRNKYRRRQIICLANPFYVSFLLLPVCDRTKDLGAVVNDSTFITKTKK